MEKLLNDRIKGLEKIFKKAIANKNYTFAMSVSNHIDEVKAILYLLKKHTNANKQEA